MKILVAGGYDTNNLGDHASIQVLLKDLEESHPDLQTVILSRHPEEKFLDNFNVKFIKNLDHLTKKLSKGRWFFGFNANDKDDHLLKITTELQSSDALLIGSGRLLIDISLDFMKGPLPYYAILVTLAKFLGIPILIYSMTIIKPETKIGNELLRYILINCRLITVRDTQSKQLVESMGVLDDRIKVLPDAAIGLDYIANATSLISLSEEIPKLNKNNQIIAINFRYINLKKQAGTNYFKNLAQICDYLVDELNCDIILVPQGTYNVDTPFTDDRYTHKRVKDECSNQNSIHVLEKRYNVQETLAIYQQCDFLFSMRRHGLIFAATQLTPIFGLSGEENTAFLFKDFELHENYIDIFQILEFKDFSVLKSAFINRNTCKEKIKQTLPSLKKHIKEYSKRISSNTK